MRSRSRTPRVSSDFAENEGEESELSIDPDAPDAPDAPDGNEMYAWHFDMLHDDARLTAFCEAFGRLPREAVGHPALDIGCGSGILGLALLQRQPAIPEVIAFERDATLARVARENVAINGKSSKVTVHAVASTSMSLDKKAKLVVAEILDAALLGEDCLGTLRHAADHLLQDGYFAIPASAEVVACAVESELLASFQRVESAWWAPEIYRQDAGDANPHDVVLEKLVAAGGARVLSNDFPAWSIDFEHLPATSRSRVLKVKVQKSGRVDAIVFWWHCYMLRGDQCASMTNAPWTSGREIGHWRQAVSVLPHGRSVEGGETLSLMAYHTDEDIWFRIVESDPSSGLMPRGSSNLGLMSSQRLWMLSDRKKYQQIQRAMDLAVKSLKQLHPGFAIQVGEHKGNTKKPFSKCFKIVWNCSNQNLGSKLWISRLFVIFLMVTWSLTLLQVLDLSDGPIMTLLCLQSFRRRGGTPRLRKLLQVARLGPRILSLESNKDDLRISKDVLKRHVKASRRLLGPKVLHVLGSPSLERKMISLVCGEPFAKECEGLPCDCQLWHHWAQVDALGFSLTSNCIFLPCSFRVKAVLIACPDLWRRRQPIRFPVQGLAVGAINDLHPDVTGRDHRFPCSLWQVDHAVLSHPGILCSVDVKMPFPENLLEFSKIILSPKTKSKVDGIATWTEVCFNGAWIPTAHISDGRFQPGPMMQGVLLAKNLERRLGHDVAVQACFHVQDGSLSLRATMADADFWKGADPGDSDHRQPFRTGHRFSSVYRDQQPRWRPITRTKCGRAYGEAYKTCGRIGSPRSEARSFRIWFWKPTPRWIWNVFFRHFAWDSQWLDGWIMSFS